MPTRRSEFQLHCPPLHAVPHSVTLTAAQSDRGLSQPHSPPPIHTLTVHNKSLSPSTMLLTVLAVLCLSLSTLPLAHGTGGQCIDGSCDLDIASPGCDTCSTNSSQCSTAWYNSTGVFCGQAVSTSRQTDQSYYYATCCPTDYPCVPNTFVSQQGGTTWDISSFWCTKRDPATLKGSSGTRLTWLWWLLASAGSSALFFFACRAYRLHRLRAYAAMQQQAGAGQPQQEMQGQPGQWSEEAALRHQSAIRQPPAGLLPSYLPPGTYAQMP